MTTNEFPIKRLLVSDFRRIEGTREIPLDAPVVLVHGSNGTGKTSILAALELALTGNIRSMERHSPDYLVHLPFFGQPNATVRADVAGYLQKERPEGPLTVDGTHLEGSPSFSDEAARFYAERCYLDQASLGRLLELYQARQPNEQSALEKFVNELLGLEKLDALREGLSAAHDFRLLKKLAIGVDEAGRQAKEAAAELESLRGQRITACNEVDSFRAAALAATFELGLGSSESMTNSELLEFIRSTANDRDTRDAAAASKVHEDLISLGGRISAFGDQVPNQQIQEERKSLESALKAIRVWEETEGARVREWEDAVRSNGVDTYGDSQSAVSSALNAIIKDLDDAAAVRVRVDSLDSQLAEDRAALRKLQARLAEAHEYSNALIESLTALDSLIDTSNICPVCDRDFTETEGNSLHAHVTAKLENLTAHGQQLINLRAERDHLAVQISRAEIEYDQLASQILTADQQQELEKRRAVLNSLSEQSYAIEEAKTRGASLVANERNLRRSIAGIEASSTEEKHIQAELNRFAALLNVGVFPTPDTFRATWAELLELARGESRRLTEVNERVRGLTAYAEQLQEAIGHEAALAKQLAEVAEQKQVWDDRVAEAKRRQAVAKDVHDAATQARRRIVQRVFTNSLNDVWRSVFTRLAPNEEFIPRFGVPNATKKSFDINLETIHRDGESSGPPQMMLSAGNLNTAALSLFLALHLAVAPMVPCLVFDDPVQAMDEVHVSQFAGLIRMLAKQNDRQVIIAVHERELFDYLALELSPAYAGDELITIELGERDSAEDQVVTRHTWRPDESIAV